MPIDKPWMSLATVQPKELPGTVGVYELAGADGSVIYIGYAGGRSLFGLRGAIEGHRTAEEPNPVIAQQARQFRYEVTANYLLRWAELLSRHHEDFEQVPEGNQASGEPLPPLTRYRWKSSAVAGGGGDV